MVHHELHHQIHLIQPRHRTHDTASEFVTGFCTFSIHYTTCVLCTACRVLLCTVHSKLCTALRFLCTVHCMCVSSFVVHIVYRILFKLYAVYCLLYLQSAYCVPFVYCTQYACCILCAVFGLDNPTNGSAVFFSVGLSASRGPPCNINATT